MSDEWLESLDVNLKTDTKNTFVQKQTELCKMRS
jgi:hypothetical protein